MSKINVKLTTILLAITLVTSVSIFCACTKDNVNEQTVQSPTIQNGETSTEVNGAKDYAYDFTLRFRLRKRNTGCNSGFSVCRVHAFDILLPELTPCYISLNLKDNTMDFYFLEKVPWAEPIFFTSDEDPFIFPDDVLKEMQLSYLEITPKDYNYNNKVTSFTDNNGKVQHCYGHVKLEIIVKK